MCRESFITYCTPATGQALGEVLEPQAACPPRLSPRRILSKLFGYTGDYIIENKGV